LKTLRLILTSLAALFLLSACDTNGLYHFTLVLEGNHLFTYGQRLPGTVLVMGGQVDIDPTAQVAGSIFILEGRVNLNGEVGEDVTLVGGELIIGPQAHIYGNLRTGGGDLRLSEQAQISGIVEQRSGLEIPASELATSSSRRGSWGRTLFNALLIGFLAYAASRYLARPTHRVAEASLQHPVVAVSMGLLTGVVGLSLLVLMAFTIVLIPVSLLGLLMLGVMVAYGWAAMGTGIGAWLTAKTGRHLSNGVTAFLGTALLMIILDLINWIPVIGAPTAILITVNGLGAVLLTRLGMVKFIPAMDHEEDF
jgi:cytoskeletal protein CcmA (bactofilin family)